MLCSTVSEQVRVMESRNWNMSCQGLQEKRSRYNPGTRTNLVYNQIIRRKQFLAKFTRQKCDICDKKTIKLAINLSIE